MQTAGPCVVVTQQRSARRAGWQCCSDQRRLRTARQHHDLILAAYGAGAAMASEQGAISVNARCAQARTQAQGIAASADTGFAIRRVKGANDATRAAHSVN